SFTIRRPTPVSRGDSGTDSAPEATFKVPALPKHLAASSNGGSPLGSPAPSPRPRIRSYNSHEKDSSDEEDEEAEELVTGFDQFGTRGPTRHPRAAEQGLARARAKAQGAVRPPAGRRDGRGRERRRARHARRDQLWAAALGAAGRQAGELEEDEGPVRNTPPADEDEGADTGMKKEEETEDARALRAILASSAGEDPDAAHIDAIPLAAPTPSEDDVYKQDVVELPESASLEDYERVPVSQFGAALLRGMGWKEGMAASKKNKGPVDPYLPQARPALLGIGAKEKEVFDDGSKGKKGKGKPERRYVPVIKKERAREGSEGGDRERRRSPSPELRRDRDRDAVRRDRDYDKGRDGNRDRDRDYGRERERDRPRDGKDYGYDKEKDRRRDRRDDDYESSRRDRDRRDRDRRY
ncbi:DExH-box splicing factor binding site-domain-containing protein, partial [Fomitopsis serialis]|uniref:DExH-box splicing factor binding site-domain-containing protein n=1 Tax=Fomitopsis serialis TaxID=139415 RepID=UPI002008D38F